MKTNRNKITSKICTSGIPYDNQKKSSLGVSAPTQLFLQDQMQKDGTEIVSSYQKTPNLIQF
jgi:hypothetical protein